MLSTGKVTIVLFIAIAATATGCGGGVSSGAVSGSNKTLFADQSGVEPNQIINSNAITVNGLGAGNSVSVSSDELTTITLNGSVSGSKNITAKEGDTMSLSVTSLGYGQTITSTINIGSISEIWRVTTKPVGGAIQSLTGSGLVLQNNGGESINILAGSTSFSFFTMGGNVAGYDITVLAQPVNPPQICGLINGVDQIGTALSNVTVVCHADVSQGTCSTCHGVSVTGMPVSHIANGFSCDQCHNTTSWLFNFHPVNHIPYNAGVTCSDCHTGNVLVNTFVLHAYSNVTYTCETCHIAPNIYAGNNQVTKLPHGGSSGSNCVNCHKIAASYTAWL